MNQQQDEQLRELEKVLTKLGYDISKEGRKIFADVVIETLDCLGSGMTQEEVYNLVHNKNSYIYVELAYFCYENGMPKLHQSLEQFHQSRSQENVKESIYTEVFKNEMNPTVLDAAFYVATYLSEKSRKQKATKELKQKVLVS